MTDTKWSEPAACFYGKRPVDIPEGAEVLYWAENRWVNGGDDINWEMTTLEHPIFYRYELPPVETEPFAVVFSIDGKVYSLFCYGSHRGGYREKALDKAAEIYGTVQFFNKHRQPVSADEIEGESTTLRQEAE